MRLRFTWMWLTCWPRKDYNVCVFVYIRVVLAAYSFLFVTALLEREDL